MLLVVVSGLLPEMATSPGVFKATAVKSMSNFPVLPPIEGTQQRGEGGQTAAAKEEMVQKITVNKKLLRHRRSKVQQQQLHMILYVFLCQCLSDCRKIIPVSNLRSKLLCRLLCFLQYDSLLTELLQGV